MAVSSPPPAGWYPDPTDARRRRWWDGASWSDETAALPAMPGVPPRVILHAESAVAIAPTPGGLAAPPVAPAPRSRPLVPGSAGPLGSGYVPPPVGVWRSPADTRPPVRGMGDAIRVVFARYATFEGRATRAEFWYFTLFSSLVSFGAVFLTLVPLLGMLVGLALMAWFVGVLIPTLALAVRRLRDAGLHWAWLFLSLVPFGGIALIVLWCQPSKYP